MSDDLVERLRAKKRCNGFEINEAERALEATYESDPLTDEAADEIERLRSLGGEGEVSHNERVEYEERILAAEMETIHLKRRFGLQVERPFAYCCAEAGGNVDACDCVNKDHGTVWFDVSATLTSKQVMDIVENVACAMCAFDGLDPDEPVLSGVVYRPRWDTREFKGRAKAAIDEIERLRSLAGEGEPVHQWRKIGCSNWYDGLPDHEDGLGPYETRTLYARPQPKQVMDREAVARIIAPDASWQRGFLSLYDDPCDPRLKSPKQ